MLVLQLAEHVFVGQSTIGISLFKLETPYADPHVRCCERCDAKTSAYSIFLPHMRDRQYSLFPLRLLLFRESAVENYPAAGDNEIIVQMRTNYVWNCRCYRPA